MMNDYLSILILLFMTVSDCSAQEAENDIVQQQFGPIVDHFKKYSGLHSRLDTVNTAFLFRSESFNLSLSPDPIQFYSEHVVVKNPFYDDDINDYNDNLINYPLSRSILYENKIVTLFEGGFVCLNIDSFERDTTFEDKLNSRKFDYHWLLNNELVAWSGNRLYVWHRRWEKSHVPIPMELQPKLFENADFLVFFDCFGEWGGTVYFYDKKNGKVHFTESTCANTVYEEKGKYYVQSDLGHGSGFTELKEIEDPRKLPTAKRKEINKTKNGEALGYADASNAYNIVFEGLGLQIFSVFENRGRRIGIAHIHMLTFLFEGNGVELKIVSPLFNNDLYTHEPITTQYGDIALISLDFWGIAKDREIAFLVIRGDKITRIDWNENHAR